MSILIGFETNFCPTLTDILDQISVNKLNFVNIPIFHPRLRCGIQNLMNIRPGPITKSDRELSSKEWSNNIVGRISGDDQSLCDDQNICFSINIHSLLIILLFHK
jgi:hypothetical protein